MVDELTLEEQQRLKDLYEPVDLLDALDISIHRFIDAFEEDILECDDVMQRIRPNEEEQQG